MKKLLITVLFVLCFIGQVAGEQGHQKVSKGTGKDLVAFNYNNKIGFKNSSGKVIIIPRFDSVRLFSEGLAAVEIAEKWGFIDNLGRFVIKPKFHYVGSFSEGLAMVGMGNKCGYIDKTGKFVIKPKFKYGYPFSEGLACVTTGLNKDNSEDKCGYIDKSGIFVIKPVFEDAWSFCDGRAMVKVAGKWGWIDRSGKYIITPNKKMINPLIPSGRIVSSSDLEWLAISDICFPKKLNLTSEVKEIMAEKAQSYSEFTIVDLNGDRIPEIIIDNPPAGGSAGATFDIFAWNKGKWSNIGRIQGGFISIDFNNEYEKYLNEYALISAFPRLGDYYIELWKFSEGKYGFISTQRLPDEITANLYWERHWMRMKTRPQ